MWDYDKLFAEGNIVGVNVKCRNVFDISSVDNENVYEWKLYYANDELKYQDNEHRDFESYIQYIVRLDEHGNVVEKLFDREADMLTSMPKLETGMFIRVNSYGESKLGFVDAENNRVIYQSGGYDFIDDDEETLLIGISSKIVEIYDKYTCGFDYCDKDVLIWRSHEYQSYLDSKSN